MAELAAVPVASASAAAEVLSRLEESAWVLAGFDRLIRSEALTASGLTLRTPEDEAAAQLLAAVGLVDGGDPPRLATGLSELLADGSLETRWHAAISNLRQVATATGMGAGHDAEGWSAQDDATLVAQGKSSALGGTMLATFAVPSLDGLAERFAAGGAFLDVGVGVGELAAAFCDALPVARVVGLDVLPRALDLARQTIATRGLQDRLEVRLLPVQDLTDVAQFDLAWMPAPFLPPHVFAEALRRVREALRPGGWLVVATGRFDGDALAVAVTRWKTLSSGGTPLTADEACTALQDAGFAEVRDLHTPPGAPALYAARTEPTGAS
jgi:SAM-dependent methyltransferase